MNEEIKQPTYLLDEIERIKTLSYDELQEFRLQIQLDRLRIRTDLENEEKVINKDWEKRATYALRAKGLLLQHLDKRLSEVKELNKRNFNNFFLLFLKEELGNNLFDPLYEEAKEKYEKMS